jgi:hypothetical protein
MRTEVIQSVVACLTAFLISAAAAAPPAPPPAPPQPFPVLAWSGVPEKETSRERYRELAECGFNINYSGFSNADANAKAMDEGKATGVKVLVSCPELRSNPEATVKRFKDHPAHGGYNLRDEPAAGDFPDLAKWAARIRAADPESDAKRPCYANLFPNYATAGKGGQLGTDTYQQYVDRFIQEVRLPMVSFDHYPVISSGKDLVSVRGEWYENLEIVSAAARKAGKPMWAFALSVPHGSYPTPTVAHVRLQVFSNLAYGAQVIQYFTYWTPVSDTWNFHDAPIRPDGTRTPLYEHVKQVNAEIQGMRGVFRGATVETVGHTGEKLPRGTRAYKPASPISEVKTGGQGAVVSLLSNGGRQYLVIVNRDPEKPMPLSVTVEGWTAFARVGKDGALQGFGGLVHETQVQAGNVFVLTWLPRQK